MLKMSALSANTGTKTLAPLLDCVIDYCLIKLRPLLNETSFQMVYVMYPHTIHSFLKHSPDFVIDGVEVGTVGLRVGPDSRPGGGRYFNLGTITIMRGINTVLVTSSKIGIS